MQLKQDIKLANEQAKYKKHCKYCGHTLTFYAFEKDIKLCKYCGKFNYRNGMVEFKNKMQKEIKNVSC